MELTATRRVFTFVTTKLTFTSSHPRFRWPSLSLFSLGDIAAMSDITMQEVLLLVGACAVPSILAYVLGRRCSRWWIGLLAALLCDPCPPPLLPSSCEGGRRGFVSLGADSHDPLFCVW